MCVGGVACVWEGLFEGLRVCVGGAACGWAMGRGWGRERVCG